MTGCSQGVRPTAEAGLGQGVRPLRVDMQLQGILTADLSLTGIVTSERDI